MSAGAATRWRSAALFAAIAAGVAAVLAVRLLVPGPVGMSDQGDGTRLLCGLGLREDHPYNTSTTDYLYLRWVDHRWYGETCGATGSGEAYHSTELWFAALAKWLTPHVTATSGLDLRVLGVVFSVLVGVVVAAAATVLARRTAARLLVAAALLLVVADATFAGYFVSAYSEPAAFVGVLALVAVVAAHLGAERARWWGALGVGAVTLFTVAAKTQTASLVAPALVVVLARLVLAAARAGRSGRRAAGGSASGAPAGARRAAGRALVRRWPALVVAAGLVAGSAGYLASQPQRFAVQNDYAAVFVEMLPHSPDPAADLRRMGLPASMADSSGVAINAPGSAAQRVDFYHFADRAGLGARLGVYAHDPARLGGMLGRGLQGMAVLRTDYTSSYPRSAGLGPNRTECRVCVLHDAWRAVFLGRSSLIVLLLLACARASGVVCASGGDRRVRAAGGTGLFLAGAVVTQFWVVMLTEGASDLIKHLVVADLLLALLVVVTATGVAGAVAEGRRPRT